MLEIFKFFHTNTYFEIVSFGKALLANTSLEFLPFIQICNYMSLFMLCEVTFLSKCSVAELALIRSKIFMHSHMIKNVPSFCEDSVSIIILTSVEVLYFQVFFIKFNDAFVMIGLQQEIVHFMFGESHVLDFFRSKELLLITNFLFRRHKERAVLRVCSVYLRDFSIINLTSSILQIKFSDNLYLILTHCFIFWA